MGSKSKQVLELSLSLRPSYVPKSISDLMRDLEKIDNVEEKLSVLNDYLNEHKEELSRVEALKLDLPQCMLLLMDAIEIIKDQITKSTKNQQGEESEISDDHEEVRRRVSEFLTRKKRSYNKINDGLQMKNIINNNFFENKYYDQQNVDILVNRSFASPPWTRYHNGQLHTIAQAYNYGGKGKEKEIEKNQEYKYNKWRESRNYKKKNPKMGFGINKGMNDIPAFGGVVVNYGVLVQPEEAFPDPPPTWRNTKRRTWTPELHAKFIQALGLLGGPEVATPKQIRDLMNVKDLTNDQVKSHLQKYRLHLRGVPRLSTRTDHQNQINGSDYRLASANSARYDQAYQRGINEWLNNPRAAASHSNSAAAQPAQTRVINAAIMENNEDNDVVHNDEPADLNFGSWLSHFGSSVDRF